MPWLIAEDKALKEKLSGLTVTDTNAPDSGRKVAVRFRLPETELADMTFPAIIIDHVGISKDEEREHRGMILLPYAPEGLPPWDDMTDPEQSIYYGEFPIPMNIDYQVTVYTRKALHRSALIAALTQQSRLHPRYAYLEIPQDGTIRRLDVLAGPQIEESRDRDGKRVFRAIYSLRVSTELLPEDIQNVQRVLGIDLGLNYGPDLQHLEHRYDLTISAN